MDRLMDDQRIVINPLGIFQLLALYHIIIVVGD
jgi:hypothetical protein